MRRVWMCWLAAVVVSVAGATAARGQTTAATSCDDVLLGPRDVDGKKVGPSSCQKLETPLTLDGRSFTRIDIGLDGSVDGFITKTGDYKEYLTNAPDLVFGQTSDEGERLPAIAKYERAKGAGMAVIFPRNRADWNGKMWVTVHGRGASFKEGGLKAWDKNLNPTHPLPHLNTYHTLMLPKAYAPV